MFNPEGIAAALAALKSAVIATSLIVGVAGSLAFAFPGHSDLVTQIDIDAPPMAVWVVLTDAAEFPDWNPEIRAIRGPLRPGATVAIEEAFGREHQVFHPVVKAATPGRALSWRGVILTPGFLSAEHYFELHPNAKGTHFIQGETLHGAALWLFDATRLLPDFDAMNTALKRRVESPRTP